VAALECYEKGKATLAEEVELWEQRQQLSVPGRNAWGSNLPFSAQLLRFWSFRRISEAAVKRQLEIVIDDN